MTAGLLALAWAGAVCIGGWARRPAPARARALVGRASRPAGRHDRLPQVERACRRVGLAVLRPFVPSPDPEIARRLGGAVVAGALTLAVVRVAAPVVALGVWALPVLRGRRRERRRLATLAADLPRSSTSWCWRSAPASPCPLPSPQWPDTRRARSPPSCAGRSTTRTTAGAWPTRSTTCPRAGEAARPLTAALVASERYGAPVVAGLERLAAEVRRDRRRRAEEAARRVPVKLLFPLVTCTLPAFALLTVAPLIAGTLGSLRL